MKKFMRMNMREGNNVSSHLNEFNNIFSHLTSKGLNFDDEMKAIFLLCLLTLSWDTFNTSISNSAPNDKLVFSDVASALLTEEIRRQSIDASGHDDAYMASGSCDKQRQHGRSRSRSQDCRQGRSKSRGRQRLEKC
ncbi:hypothetical protein L7F22_020730 [Adiantum nelumboides]|nr:hypothetical protein [Adiantum nelumboides]